jgi:phage FluMu protein Com
MGNYKYYIPSEEEIKSECEIIRANRSPDIKLPIHFYGFINLYVNHMEFIQEKARKDGMPVDDMLKDEIRFVFYLINKSLGSSKNFRCARCNVINDSFSKLCHKCYYKKSSKMKKLRRLRREKEKLDDDK